MLLMRAGGRPYPETAVGPVAPSALLRWQQLGSGRFPAATGEAVVAVWLARARQVAVGDRVRIGEGATAADLEVVGLGLGHGLIALINSLAPTAPMGAAALSLPWLPAGFAVGLMVTMVASWLPGGPGEPAGGAAPGRARRRAHGRGPAAADARRAPAGRRAGCG
ncbi:hypothetical protein ACIA8R_32790 [Nonomuraea sp. NPDC051191]|uniref:hypothetical protein n=1 Tax=Nonomuraea sp. NPDC051191 TaxID=3364372 RepID=UPI00378A816F